MKNIKLYEVRKDSKVYAISLVKQPAIESNFIYLSAEQPQRVCLEKDEKHLVYGAVLIPNKPIYRYDNTNGEYYIQFPEDTIEQLAHHYLQEDNIYSFTSQHKDVANDVAIVESWIKTSENDKSVDLGIQAPVGTWFIGAKVDNDEIWNGIKEGTMQGFSVESFLNFEEIIKNNMQKENFETVEVNETFWDKIKAIIVDALKSPSTPQTEAEQTAEVVVADMIEENTPVVEEPIVETPMQEEPTVDEPVAEEPTVEPEVIADEVVDEVVEETPNADAAENTLQEVINELNAKIDELNEQIEELKKENVKLSKQPSTKPINTHMSANQSSNFDRMLAVMNGTAFLK